MPDVQELFRAATQQVRPDPGALERQHRNQRWRVARRRTGAYALVAALLAAGLAIGIGALETDTRPAAPSRTPTVRGLLPTPSLLAGIWLNDGGPSPGWSNLLVRFSPDGTVAFDDLGVLDTTPAVLGTYELDGRTITFSAGPRSAACTGGDTWTWEAGVPDDGRLHVVNIEDGTGNCSVGVGTEWTFTRVSPVSPATARITVPEPTGKAVPPPSEATLRGIWLLGGSGTLVRLGEDRTYALDDMGRLGISPSDVGTFQVDGRTITFTSGAGSSRCAQGDLWVWKDVDLQGRVLRGVVSKDECRNRTGGATSVGQEVSGFLLAGLLRTP
jgi:hypothetical protein